MTHAQLQKFFAITPPAAIIDNAAATTAVVDLLNWDYCTIVVFFGAMDIAATAMKIQESDTTSDANTLSSGADVTGLVFGTSTNLAGSASTLPSATDDNKFFLFQFPTLGRKRYVDLSLTLGDGAAGTYVTAFAILSRGKQGPDTAAEQGASQILRLP